MCIIIFKPQGAEMPSKSLLEKAYKINPHGCGFCTPTKNYKGLSFAYFLKKLKECSKDEPILIHLRYATHGSVKRSNCHPFYDAETNTYFMHNGTLCVKTSKDMTDSETAFRKILMPSKDLDHSINSIIGYSRFAFMVNGEVKLYGDWVKRDGLYFSNQRIF